MFCDGVDPGRLMELWTRETWIRRIETAEQIADVRNRGGLGIDVVSIFAQDSRLRKAGGAVCARFSAGDSASWVDAVSAIYQFATLAAMHSGVACCAERDQVLL